MNQQQFLNALNDIDERYILECDKVLNARYKVVWKYTNTVLKQVAIVFLCILILFSSAVTVQAMMLNRSILKRKAETWGTTFIAELDELETAPPLSIETWYTVTGLPDTFYLTEDHQNTRFIVEAKQSLPVFSVQQWSNYHGHSIVLCQYLLTDPVGEYTNYMSLHPANAGKYAAYLYTDVTKEILVWAKNSNG